MDKLKQQKLIEKFYKQILNDSEIIDIEQQINQDNTFLEMLRNESDLIKSIKNWGKNQLLARLDVIHEEVKNELEAEIEVGEINSEKLYSLDNLLEMFKEPAFEEVRSDSIESLDFEQSIKLDFPINNFELTRNLLFQLSEVYEIDLEVSICNFKNEEVYSRTVATNSKAFIINTLNFTSAAPGRYTLSIYAKDWRFVTKFKSLKYTFEIGSEFNPYH